MSTEVGPPFKIQVRVDLRDTLEITTADLMEVRHLAYLHDQRSDEPLDNDFLMTDLFNELIESKIDLHRMDIDDFDWDGVPWETLINAVKGLDANGEPLPPPEIPGQTTIDDALAEMS